MRRVRGWAVDEATEATAATFAALANGHRVRVAVALAAGPLSVGELATILGIPQPNTSMALAVMRDAGVVAFKVDRSRRVYELTEVGRELADMAMRIHARGLG